MQNHKVDWEHMCNVYVILTYVTMYVKSTTIGWNIHVTDICELIFIYLPPQLHNLLHFSLAFPSLIPVIHVFLVM